MLHGVRWKRHSCAIARFKGLGICKSSKNLDKESDEHRSTVVLQAFSLGLLVGMWLPGFRV